MKTCNICQHFHNHDYCPYCGALAFVMHGHWTAINRRNVRMARAHNASIRERAIKALANISKPSAPSMHLVKRSLGI